MLGCDLGQVNEQDDADDARHQRGQTNQQILWHVFKRSLILIAVGLLVNASPILGENLVTQPITASRSRSHKRPVRLPYGPLTSS